ncbi:MAG: hypothetical protein ABL921_12380 [Pirellula sp.]
MNTPLNTRTTDLEPLMNNTPDSCTAPTQRTDDEGPAIPEMREALLHPEELRELGADLEKFATVHQVLCKSGARDRSPATNRSVLEAIENLIAKSITAIQVRYRFDNHDWTDTLVHDRDCVRLIRCQHSNELSEAATP